jgi:hypothetical protein
MSLTSHWIPAFAGMTAASSAHVSQMTLVPKILFFWQFSGVFYKRITSLSLRERDGDESVVL